MGKHKNVEFRKKFSDLKSMMSQCIVIAEDSILVSPECQTFFLHIFTQILMHTFIVILDVCLPSREQFIISLKLKISKWKPATLSLHSTSLSQLFRCSLSELFHWKDYAFVSGSYPATHDSLLILPYLTNSDQFWAN